MVTPEELQYLHWLGSVEWDGESDAVEFAPWLGATTIALASGMVSNPRRKSGLLHTFDNFVWRPFMEPRSKIQRPNGSDFSDLLRANLGSLASSVVMHRVELPKGEHRISRYPLTGDEPLSSANPFDWEPPVPIGIIFIDGAKSYDAMRLVLSRLVPHLAPGGAWLACQDYADPFAYWVPLLMQLNSERWSAAHVLSANTVTFRSVSPVPQGTPRLPAIEDLSSEEGISLLETAADALRARGNPSSARMVQLGICIFLADKGDRGRAIKYLRSLCWRFPLVSRNSRVLREVSEAIERCLEVRVYPRPLRLIRECPGATIRWSRKVRSMLR
ncbi:MAG: hypothetical protein EA369_02275 [Bradymonadales bacterium]|nr:MAG: hypothetical protein EA369_02275 [Bradymonadales bacterium]